jgi:hypothetical protein
MSKSGLLSGSTLASRMPTVARLLGLSAPPSDQGDPGDEDPDEPEQPEDPQDPEQQPDDPDEPEEPDDRSRLLAAFERDAAALVAAERTRCIAVFTSDAGKRNPDGAAAVLTDTRMDAKKANAFLGTCSGNSRTNARDRLNGDASTRVRTGGGGENTDANEAVGEHRKRQAARNKTVRGGKAVNAEDKPAATQG